MTKEQIIASARIFAKLQAVLGKNNVADVQNAAIFPMRVIVAYNKEAFSRHVLTEDTQRFLAKEYDAFTLEAYQESLENPLSATEQGVWQLAYNRAKQEFSK